MPPRPRQPAATHVGAPMVPDLLTYQAAAAAMSVGVEAIERLVAEGRLTSVALGPRTRRITRSSLDALTGRGRG